MKLITWLDVLPAAFGLLAMWPQLWCALRRRCFGFSPMLGRPMQTATALLFYLGLSSFLTAGIDFGLVEWDRAYRLRDKDNIRKNMMAPDFCLQSLDEDKTVRLSDFRGHKPVVLIFGNYY